MSDRELMELAANSCGIELIDWSDEWHGDSGNEGPGFRIKGLRGYPEVWNPLRDDGDAMRLAVRLLASIDFRKTITSVWVSSVDVITTDQDPRRAIVKAAAEVGRRMP